MATRRLGSRATLFSGLLGSSPGPPECGQLSPCGALGSACCRLCVSMLMIQMRKLRALGSA